MIFVKVLLARAILAPTFNTPTNRSHAAITPQWSWCTQFHLNNNTRLHWLRGSGSMHHCLHLTHVHNLSTCAVNDTFWTQHFTSHPQSLRPISHNWLSADTEQIMQSYCCISRLYSCQRYSSFSLWYSWGGTTLARILTLTSNSYITTDI